MSESQLVLERFQLLLERLPKTRVAIYGLGGHTEYILKNMQNCDAIVGLMDAKRTGEIVYGLNVFGADEIAEVADVIIIIARVAVERLIYERIKQLKECGIEIYNVSGERLSEKYANMLNDFGNNSYWLSSKEDLKNEIAEHKVISFDIFDTLLMRRIIRPHAELGFETEKKLLVVRKDMVDCFYYALELGKKVYLLSDMYYSSDELSELLSKNGILGFEEIIVSCEFGATKESGELYDVLLQKVGGGDILHIGDNMQADIENAKKHGIDTYHVMSAYDMLLNSPMYQLLRNVPTVADSRMIGEWSSIVMNSPFALNGGSGRVIIPDLKICSAYFAPIVGEFMKWMIRQLQDCGDKTVVLFLARDGYLIKRLYEQIKEILNVQLPDSIYFPASRTAVSEQYSLKNNYIEYANSIGVCKYKRVIAFDLATKGTIVSELAKILNIDIELICFATFNIEAKFSKNKTHSFLGDYSFYELPYNFLSMYELLETMLIPKQTQFLYVDDDLSLVYSPEESESGRPWAKIAEFQQALIEQVCNYIRSYPDWLMSDVCIKTADNILGLLSSKFAIVSDDVRQSFVFDSPPEGVGLSCCWDRLVD